MKVRNRKVKKLLEKYKEIALLARVNMVLNWDMRMTMPRLASKDRTIQKKQLRKVLIEKWTDKEFSDLINLMSLDNSLALEEKAIVRNLKENSEYYQKVGKDLILEINQAVSSTYPAWREARDKDDFSLFAPNLEKLIALRKEAAERLGYEKNPLDALIDRHEKGMNVERYENIFSALKRESLNILKKVKNSDVYLNDKKYKLSGKYLKDKQVNLLREILESIGYKEDEGVMQDSLHAFTSLLGKKDVRLTFRVDENDFTQSLRSGIHEGGHALHMQGINSDYAYTPLWGSPSNGISESQSRYWENQVGKSYEFMTFLKPLLNKFYPNRSDDFDIESIYSNINKINISPVRVRSDELTYNLHIMMRFEIENLFINGKIKVKDLPEVWNEKSREYLGVSPKHFSDGVLQDVHWAKGSFGHFPSYTLGNLYAAQFAAKMREVLNFDEFVKDGNFEPILVWLREKVHKWGRVYEPDELIHQATGEKLNPNYFIEYIKEKYGKLYNLDV